MKKKKGVIAILLIIALLALGIGYAALTGSLTITGSASAVADDSNYKVVFINAEAGDANYSSSTVVPTATAAVDSDDATKATFSVTNFTTENDTVTFTYTVENQSNGITAKVSGIEISAFDNSDYFSITASLPESATSVTLDPGETTTVTVTVTCIQTPTAEVSTGDVTITLATESV